MSGWWIAAYLLSLCAGVVFISWHFRRTEALRSALIEEERRHAFADEAARQAYALYLKEKARSGASS